MIWYALVVAGWRVLVEILLPCRLQCSGSDVLCCSSMPINRRPRTIVLQSDSVLLTHWRIPLRQVPPEQSSVQHQRRVSDLPSHLVRIAHAHLTIRVNVLISMHRCVRIRRGVCRFARRYGASGGGYGFHRAVSICGRKCVHWTTSCGNRYLPDSVLCRIL